MQEDSHRTGYPVRDLVGSVLGAGMTADWSSTLSFASLA